MKRLDYTAFYDELKTKLGRRPNAPEVIDALLKAGWAGSGYRRVLEGKRVFLEQEEEVGGQRSEVGGQKSEVGGQEESSGDRNDGAVELPVAGMEDRSA